MTLTDSGQRLYDSIAPLMAQDAENGNVGQVLCAAFATMLDPVAVVVRDGGTVPGWANRFDVDNVDPSWLPWLAQFLGDTAAVQAATTDAAKRALITTPANFTRGRPSAIIAAAQATLTGTQSVLVLQRTGGNPWTLSVTTYDTETPDPTATTNAIMSSMPAWLIPTIQVVPFGSYATLAASHSSYTLMEAAHTHYSDIPVNPAA